MTHHIHRTLTNLVVVFFLSLSIGGYAADAITEQRVNELMKRVDDAAIKRDIPALLAFFVSDPAITSDWLSPEGVSKKKFGRQEYGDYVKYQFPTATKRERTHSNTKITIIDSGTKATVTTETKEAFTLPDQAGVSFHGPFLVTTFETIKLVQRGNEVLIASLDISLPNDTK